MRQMYSCNYCPPDPAMLQLHCLDLPDTPALHVGLFDLMFRMQTVFGYRLTEVAHTNQAQLCARQQQTKGEQGPPPYRMFTVSLSNECS